MTFCSGPKVQYDDAQGYTNKEDYESQLYTHANGLTSPAQSKMFLQYIEISLLLVLGD